MRYDNFISDHHVAVYRRRGRLPHWFVDQATYSVTFRLKDSLPRDVALELFAEHDRLLASARNPSERVALERTFALQLDGRLDAGYGSCILRHHGDKVADVLLHRHREDYFLNAWCVMPNHVHTLFYVERGLDVPKILHAWKSVSSHRIGEGTIWQREYFDRIVRSRREFMRERDYIRRNPAEAGLRNWRWVG